MKVEVQKTFEKDVSGISDKKLAIQLNDVISEIENCKTLSEISHLKKIISKGNYFRIRMGNYRIGFKTEKETVILLRFMHRKDIYKYFP